MNILLIIILAVLLLSLCSGYKNGFLKTVFSLISWAIVFIACSVATPMVTDILIEKTDIEVVIQSALDEKIEEMMQEALEETGISELPEGIPEGVEFELPEELQAALPEELRNMLLNNNDNIEETPTEGALLDTSGITESIVGIISFLIVMVSVRIALAVVELVLGIASKLPIIGPLDKLLGLLCGAGKGLIWCWIILTIISVMALTGTNTEWVGYIADSQVLTWLQDNNIILNLLVK